MFHKKALKLAGLYLSIIMFISLFFSIVVFQLSTQELDRGIRGPDPIFEIEPGRDLPQKTRIALREEASQRSEDAKDHVRDRLVLINFIILFTAGFLSYYLASKTLRPIEEAHEAQSRFTADASHELRTPIAAMRSEIEVALMDPKLTIKQSKKLLESNLEELDKLTALSSGLLKLAQNEHGTLNMTNVELSGIIDQSVARVAAKSKAKQVNIESKISDGIQIYADAGSIVDLFVTILDNAIKYSSEKTTVNITTNVQRKKVTINIKDQGIGMLASDMIHIFERFYRADSARSKQRTNGYGIGLSIAKQIVDVHHGTILVDSQPNKGSTFYVCLPLAS